MAKIKLSGDKERDLRLTVGSLRRFERRSGVKLFKTLAKVLADVSAGSAKKMSDADGMRMFTEVFPGIDEVSAFLYECCVPTKEQAKLSFDDFCDDIPVTAMGDVFSVVMKEIAEFMPAQNDVARTAESEQGTSDPLER